MLKTLSSSVSRLKSKTQRSGAEKEREAERYLIEQGLILVERNYWCKLGEIDLIMRDQRNGQEILVFVEVRYRKNTQYGSPQETITTSKQRKLWRTAEYYLQRYSSQNTSTPACRFDVVAITMHNNRRQLDWIPNALQG